MKPLFPNCKKVTKAVDVFIPSIDGDTVAETIQVEVEVWENPKTKEVFLDGHARAKLENAKARRMGLLSAEQIKELREYLNLTQRELAELLQIGEKSWTRWETGRERPSRSLNVLLNALYDGRIDLNYLRQLQRPELRRTPLARLETRSSQLGKTPVIRWETKSSDVSRRFEELV